MSKDIEAGEDPRLRFNPDIEVTRGVFEKVRDLALGIHKEATGKGRDITDVAAGVLEGLSKITVVAMLNLMSQLTFGQPTEYTKEENEEVRRMWESSLKSHISQLVDQTTRKRLAGER